jgi:Tfp pilus assembly protein PilF
VSESFLGASGPQIDQLLTLLKAPGADPRAVVRQWQATVRAPETTELLRRASLARRFDLALMPVLAEGLSAAPVFDTFIQLPEVRTLPRGVGFAIEEDVRAAFAAEWRSRRRDEWTAWHRRLAEFEAARADHDPVTQLFHLVRADTVRARQFFAQEFARAEQRYDLAQCFSLLEVLTQAQADLGPDLAQAKAASEQRYSALSMFASDFYRTRTYQQRPGSLAAIHAVTGPESGDTWIFHLHATGGMGKTMFLRWFVTEQLRHRRTACARVDFDDVNTSNVARHPWLLLLPFAQQLNEQVERQFFSGVVEQLTPFAASLWLPTAPAGRKTASAEPPSLEHFPGDDLVRKFAFIAAEVNTGLVLILDTLEDVVLASEFALIFGLLRELHARAPRLRVVLAGRYNIPKKLAELQRKAGVQALAPALAQAFAAGSETFALTRFSDEEARQYLGTRGVESPEIVNEVVAKLREPADEEGVGGINPFNLALIADIIAGLDEVTVDQIREMPSGHFAYLIERVIKRIPQQPLRWVVRYGALPRRLTPGFITDVLLEPLREALAGGTGHVPVVQTRGGSEIREPDHWVRDPNARLDSLWGDLCRYEAPQGWIWKVQGSEDVVQFHSDVLDPMRDLLSTQPVFPQLQTHAIRYFEQLAAGQPDWADWTCEAIFHNFQRDGDGARGYWEVKLGEARGQSRAARRQVASEILRREYARDERVPLRRGEPPRPIISIATLRQGHVETARAILDDNGFLMTTDADWAAFRRHVLAILDLAPTAQEQASCGAAGVVAHYRAAECLARVAYDEAQPFLFVALETAAPDERFGLELHLAHVLGARRLPDAAAHYRAAIAAHPGPSVTGVSLADVHLGFGNWLRSEGQFTSSLAAFDAALEAAGDNHAAATRVRLNLGWVTLRAWELDRAAAIVQELQESPAAGFEVARLDAAVAIVVGDARRAIGAGIAALERASGAEQRGSAHDLLARAEAEQLNITAAFQQWEQVDTLFGQASSTPGALEASTLRRAIVEGRSLGNYAAARESVARCLEMPGIHDMEIGTGVLIERMFLEVRSGEMDRARATLGRLRETRRPELPPLLRARILCHALALQVLDINRGTRRELRDLLAQVEPMSSRIGLAWAFHAAVPVDESWLAKRRVLEQFPRWDRQHLGAAMEAIQLAEVHRVFGSPSRAHRLLVAALEEALGAAQTGSAVLAMQGLRRLRSDVRVPHRARRLLDHLPTAPTFAHAALIVEVAGQRVDAGDLTGIADLLEWSLPAIEGEWIKTRWHAEHAVLRAIVAAAEGNNEETGSLISAALAMYQSIGDAVSAQQVESRVMAIRERPRLKVDVGVPEPPPSVVAPGPLPAPETMPSPSPSALPNLTPARHTMATPREVFYRIEEGWSFDRAAERLIADPVRPWFADLVPAWDVGHDSEYERRLEWPAGPASSLPWEWLSRPGLTHRARPSREGDGTRTARVADAPREVIAWMQHAFTILGRSMPVDGHWHPGIDDALRPLFREDVELPVIAYAVATLRTRLFGDRDLKDATVLVVKPRSSGHRQARSTNTETRAGVQLESIYARLPFAQVRVTESPDERELGELIDRVRPAVIHVVTSITDRYKGVMLEFDDGPSSGPPRLLSARALGGVLRSPKAVPPFVVLDIVRPSSDWETARALLMRNQFACELLYMEAALGILATGLAQPWDVSMQAEAIARHVVGTGSQRELTGALQGLFDGSPAMDHRLGFAGTALFSPESEMPCRPA